MAESEMTTVMISKEAVRKAKIIGAHEDKNVREVVEESIEQKLARSKSVPAETKAELAKS
jgi:hypothetical protein